MITHVFDLETNGFVEELDRIHCGNIYDTESHQHERYDPVSAPVFHIPKRLDEADRIVGHNIVGFDVPALQKLNPGWVPKAALIDTYVWAACVWPDIKDTDFGLYRKGILPASEIGKYTLRSFGFRLGVYKGDFGETTDWAEWTPEMSDYCEQDVVVTLKLLDKLEQTETSWEQVSLEMLFNRVISRQNRIGVYFNHKRAVELYGELAAKREKLREQLTAEFPPFYKRKGKLFTPKKDCKKRVGEWMGYVAGAPHQKIELVEFNPASSTHVARILMQRFDWIPTEFTGSDTAPPEMKAQYDRLGIFESTTPKVDDEIITRLPFPEIEPLAEFLTLNKRCGQISEGKQSWLNHFNEKTHRIHGVCYQFGAVTGRCTHFGPNLAAVPANHSPHGPECRSLFTVPPGYVLVGSDADGLEAVCLAHYLAKYDEGAFTETILEGEKSKGTDTHTLNRIRLGLASRDIAKTWFYAFLYGSGDANLGLVAQTDDNYKGSDEDPGKLGKRLRAKLSVEFTGLGSLITDVKSASRRGWLKGLDGRHIPVRSQHAALNALLQSAGAVIMKKALVMADNHLKGAGLVPLMDGGKDYEFVLNVHDEFQAEVLKIHGDTVGKIMASSITEAAETFQFRCPLSAGYSIGQTWKETH